MAKIPELPEELQTYILVKLQQPLQLIVNSLLRALIQNELTPQQKESAIVDLVARGLVTGYLSGWEDAYDSYKAIKVEGSSERRKVTLLIESFFADFKQFAREQEQAFKEHGNSSRHGNNRLKRLEPEG